MTENEVFSLQLTHHRFFFLVYSLFLDGFHPRLHPPISIYPFVCPAITSITLSLPPPFIDPLYCGRDLWPVLPAATKLHTKKFLAEEKSMCTTCNIAKGHKSQDNTENPIWYIIDIAVICQVVCKNSKYGTAPKAIMSCFYVSFCTQVKASIHNDFVSIYQ